MTESITELFAIPGYSELGLMPPGTPSTLVRTFFFRDRVWHVKVLPLGFNKGVPRSVGILVVAVTGYPPSGITISIEILDDSWERTVFHEEETLGGDDRLKCLGVKMSALEEASCIHNDNIRLRCTLSKKKKKQKRAQQQTASRSKWWHRLRNIIFCDSKQQVGPNDGTNLEKGQ